MAFPQSVLVIADESAQWKVAGLRQIDRLLLALNDFFGLSTSSEPVVVCLVGCDRDSPVDLCLTKIVCTSDLTSLEAGNVLILSTRLVLGRDALSHMFEGSRAVENFPGLVMDGAELARQMREGPDSVVQRLRIVEREGVLNTRNNAGESDWSYLANRNDISHCARALLRSTGKSQDGFVSRFVNRPLSRGLSQLLVGLPVSPNQWTLLFMALPIAGAILVIRGDYLGFALGALLFQLHSALDGCDGEMARVKYLESRAGSRLDALCDRMTTLAFAVSLGVGLFRQHGNTEALGWLYVAEGVGAALLIGTTETLLLRKEIDVAPGSGGDPYRTYVAARRESFNQGDHVKLMMIKHSGMLSFGEGAASFFGELTKRDVFNFVFMLLAICGLAQWVLHILALSAVVIVVIGLREMLSPAVDVNSAA